MKDFFSSRWSIVLGTMLGLTVGTGSMMAVTFSLFVKPVTEELGWSRAAFSAGPLLISVALLFFQPLFGWLLDRFGVKRTVLPLVALMAAALTGFSMMPGSILVFYAIYLVFGMAASGQSAPMYAKVVSMWFDKGRGMALGIATSGAAIGNIVMPLVTQHFIDTGGWRSGYAALAVMNFLIAFTVVAVFLREPPGYVVAGTQQASEPPIPGVTLKEALATRNFWLLAAIILLTGFGLNGAIKHSVALLTDRHWTSADAVGLLSASGVASIFGRIIGGFVLDKSPGPRLPASLLVIPAISCALLASGWGGLAPVLAVILLGFAYGLEVDVLAYFFSRFFGLRSFGQIYGVGFSAFAIGSGLGPAVMGLSFDHYHSYTPALLLNIALLVSGVCLALLLGPYAFASPRPSADDTTISNSKA